MVYQKKKLSHSIGLLSKIRHVPKHLMQTIYYSLFSSHLIYACEIWGQNQTNQHFKKLLLLQEKALKLINFQPQASFSNNLFKESKILKISDFLNYKYALFVRNSLRKENLQIDNDMFTLLGLNHTHNTRAAINHLDIPQRQTTHYGTYSVTSIASSAWDNLQRNTIESLLECKISEFKKIIFQLHTSLNTTTNLHLICFATILSRFCT